MRSMEEFFFYQTWKNNLRTYDNIRKIATGQGYHYATGCLLDYSCFQKYDKLIAIDLKKRQKLHADPKPIQQINFTGNLNRAEGATTFFIIVEAKKNSFRIFSKETVKLL